MEAWRLRLKVMRIQEVKRIVTVIKKMEVIEFFYDS